MSKNIAKKIGSIEWINRWTDAAGKKTEYFTEVLKKHGQDHNPPEWIGLSMMAV